MKACGDGLARLWCASLLSWMPFAVSAQVDDLTVVEAVWTTRVTNRQHVDQVPNGSVARPLYFWTRLQGGPAALELLAKSGKLPIVHQWVHSTLLGEEAAELEPEQEEGKRLQAGHIADYGGVSALVKDSGTFSWRTWSHKESVWGGTWIVTVRYSDGEPVLCGGRRCRWFIELR